MAITRTTPTSERAVTSKPAGINLNKPLFAHDLRDIAVTNITIEGEIVLGGSTTGLTLTTTAPTPATVLRFDTNRASADGDVQRFSFRAQNDAGTLTEYAQLNVQLNDNTAATFDGSFELACMVAGTMTTVFDSNVTAAGVVTTTIPSGDLIINDALVFNTGVASVATEYAVLRNADGTNLLQLNVPTEASIELSVNNITEATLSATIFDLTANALTTTGNIGIGAAASATNKITSAVGTITTAAEVFTGTGTWNAAGVTFDGITLAVTDTASAAASRLIQLSVGGVSQFSVTKAGAVTSAGAYTGTVLNATAATNQIVLDSDAATTTTITAPAPVANRIYTIPDIAADSSFAMLAGTQTFTGLKTFTSLVTNTVSGNSIRLTNTADAASVQVGIFEGNRATIADNDAAYISFDLSDSAGNQDESVRLTWQATTVADGATQDSDLLIAATVNNALTTMLTFDGSANQIVHNVGSTFAGTTIADLGAVTTADINGGTLDAVTIGATTPAAATVSTLSVTGTDIILDSDIANTGTLRFTTGAAAAVITLPNATGTLYSTVASSISSAQLLSSMSDETGTGLLVFATAPAIVGGSHIELTGLSIRSTGAAFDQLFATATVFTADRTLNFAIGDANRTLTMTGDATLNQDVSTTANPTFGNLTITSFAANWTNAGRTVADAGILTTVDINGGSIDGTAIGAAATSTIVGTTIDATTDFTIGSLVITSNILTATGRLTTAMTVPTVGTGFDGAETALWACKGRVGAAGPIISEFIFDLTNLRSSATADDIIGEVGAANCHMGQVTAAIQGTIQAMEIVCLETPATGDPDIDFYTATEATGTEDTLITGLTETIVYQRAASWANGDVRGVTTVPAANGYLYLAVGSAGGVAGTYTAGKFKVTLYGTA